MIEKRGLKSLKRNSKLGQATTFVVLGIVILGVVLLIGYARNQFLFGPVSIEKLQQKGMGPIEDHIESCVLEVAPEYFETIGIQGGYLATPQDTYRRYLGEAISYLCYNMEDAPTCYSRYLTKNEMEIQLEEVIYVGLGNCLSFGGFARGADVSIGEMAVDVKIGEYESFVDVHVPIRIQRGDTFVEESEFNIELDVPLGALFEVSRDVIQAETTLGEFDQVPYMLGHRGQFVIDKKRPYPDKLYILKSKDSDYVFQFFVQGEA
ncbi:hypothetical protein HN992_00845 [Candidatus Woesearchaeota archaeon]|nr:hypothetical protein [Candidatus Woesearchaeota archaeon]MBT4058617.1 hypothetical protein [Candidatus Woesearchaeota archaeon]MBT4207951.1 hypothetical protein [Candidatus Woesearchaeota archaeon]MBT5042975.1 hypothetical protein [Candidatus Woesearchaeota archaeon]MBT6940981.1 hypothetical protein [Candidatus Woesearchaeota archaeon]